MYHSLFARLGMLLVWACVLATGSVYAQQRPLSAQASPSPQEVAYAKVLAETNRTVLQQMATDAAIRYTANRARAEVLAAQNGWPLREELPDGTLIELQGVGANGQPVYYQTENLDAAESSSTDQLWSGGLLGLSLEGNGMTLGEWDGGAVRTTHQELTGRVTQVDGATSLSNHATHVGGTLIASGVVASAKGMAPQAHLDAHDWSSDESEMATAAAGGMLVSNHSYGTITGWASGSWSGNSGQHWWGDDGDTEDWKFGAYNYFARWWDSVAVNAPYYLIVKSAGNDRNDSHSGSHYVYSGGNWVQSSATREQDGGADGYDCISTNGNAKNILTVGAVDDIPGGYNDPSDVVMSSFSGWGPTDDGRIKPDIVGNGIGLYSSLSGSNSDYSSYSGTSMAAPNVAGSLILLQEHYADLHTSFMRSATLKGLVIHNADEAGSADGPDYRHGWGMFNAAKAAQHITNADGSYDMQELTLNNSATYTQQVYSDGTTPLRATICWTEKASVNYQSFQLNPTTSRLVNDLDLRLIGASTYSPYILDPAIPGNAATTGDNFRDNVEQVYIAAPPAGWYTVQVTHKGTLYGGNSQPFSLLISGKSAAPGPVAAFTAVSQSTCPGGTISFNNQSTGTIQSYSWSFPGGNPTTSTLPNPTVTYATAGMYDVTLIVSGTDGNDTLLQTDYTIVNAPPTVSVSPVDTLCATASPVTLSGQPSGGTFSGTGITGNSFDPGLSGSGTFAIQYDYTDGNGCASTANTSVVVAAQPSVTWAGPTDQCVDSAPVVLTGGTPANGSYSGPGVSGNMFTPVSAGSGTHTLTYSYIEHGCTYTAQQLVEVLDLPTVSIAPVDTLCTAATAITLSGQPAGGSFTGQGMTGNSFDPGTAGTGTFTLQYTYTDGSGCTNATTTDVVVVAQPTASWTGVVDACVNDAPITLSGATPIGGTYAGAGVSGNTFTPAAAGTGAHTLTYTYAAHGCTTSTQEAVEVFALPVVTINPVDTLCLSASPVTVVASPSGGTLSGTGVSGTTFSPGVSGQGTFPIQYTYSDTNGCSNNANIDIVVVPTPTVSWTAPADQCVNGSPITLPAGTPSGGTFAGPGVSGNIFSPITAGAGTHLITYTTTAHGCAGFAEGMITVLDLPAASIAPVDTMCANEAPVTLSGSPAGGNFTGIGVSGNTFDPAISGAGIFNVSYNYTSGNGCTGAASTLVTVGAPLNVAWTGPEDTCETASAISLNTGTPAGGTYAGPGISGNLFTPADAGVGVHALTYTYSQYGCIDSVQEMVEVFEVPSTPTITIQGNVLTSSSPDGNQWLLNGIPIPGATSHIFVATIAGVYKVVVTRNGCESPVSEGTFYDPNSVSIAAAEQLGLSAYPNPAKDLLNVQFQIKMGQTYQLALYTATGQLIQTSSDQANESTTTAHLDVSGLATGVYFLQVKVGEANPEHVPVRIMR